MVYDIAIIGGGVAGITLANALIQASECIGSMLKIAVIEARSMSPNNSPLRDARALALSWHSAQTLSAYRLWQGLSPVITPIEKIVANAKGGLAQVHLNAGDYRLQAFGYVIALPDLQYHMYQQCLQSSQVQVYCPDRPIALHDELDRVTLDLESGQSLQAALVVGADGQPSWLGEQLNMQWHCLDFNQHAVLCNVEMTASLSGCAYERFTPDGPIALLPRQGNKAALVWCLSPEQAQEMLDCTDDFFISRFQRDFGYGAGRFLSIGKRQLFPLKLLYNDYPIAHRSVLIANAAQQLHPIAGQGFNLGIRDIHALVQSIIWAKAQGIPLGDYTQLDYYWRQRQTDQEDMIRLTTALVQIFSTSAPSLYYLGQLGLGLTQWSRTLAHHVVRPLLGKGSRHV